jgi:phage tail-like protein
MATQRDRPYGSFNFIVEVDGAGNLGGFSEIVLPELSIEVIEYRAGGDKELGVRKLPGLVKYSNLVLKRGLAGAMNLYQWVNDVRNGSGTAYRDVVIHLQNESRSDVVWTWKVVRAWPAKYRFSNLDAKGKDVEVEILELALERFEIE